MAEKDRSPTVSRGKETVMYQFSRDEKLLGELAMKFRGNHREDERRKIAKDYSEAVERLIRSGQW
jgi:hypothetical protein